MTALTTINTVGEGCCSDQVAALSYLMQDFNMKLVTEIKSICNAHRKSNTIDRMEDRQRIQLFADYYDSFNSRVEHIRSTAGKQKCHRLPDFIAGDTNKSSCVDLEAREAKYAEGIKNGQDNKSRAEFVWPRHSSGNGRRSYDQKSTKEIR